MKIKSEFEANRGVATNRSNAQHDEVATRLAVAK